MVLAGPVYSTQRVTPECTSLGLLRGEGGAATYHYLTFIASHLSGASMRMHLFTQARGLGINNPHKNVEYRVG